MAKRKTYYEILDVDSSADEKAIRKAYRKAVRENHPDINANSKKANKRTRDLNAALEILLDPELRQQYDDKLALREEMKLERRRRRTERYRANRRSQNQAPFTTDSSGTPFDLDPEEPDKRRYPDFAEYRGAREYSEPTSRWQEYEQQRNERSQFWARLTIAFFVCLILAALAAVPIAMMAKDFELSSLFDQFKPDSDEVVEPVNKIETIEAKRPASTSGSEPNQPDFVNPFLDANRGFDLPGTGLPKNPVQNSTISRNDTAEGATLPSEASNDRSSGPLSSSSLPSSVEPPREMTSANVAEPERTANGASNRILESPIEPVKPSSVSAPLFRVPAPSKEEQFEVETELTELYKPEFDRASNLSGVSRLNELRKLAEKMFDMHETSEDTIYKFVLLRAAHRTAFESGDPGLTCRVIDTMTEQFEVDQINLRAMAIKRWAEMAVFNFSGRSQKQMKHLLVRMLTPLAEYAHRQGRFDEAVLHYELAVELIVNKPDLIESLSKRMELAKADSPLEDATDAVTDVRLSKLWWQAIGEYRCFSLGDWSEGVSYLAKGADEKLVLAAEAEMRGGNTPERKISIANQWWEAAGKKSRSPILRRAKFWYEQTLDDVAGEQKDLVVDRLAMIEEELGLTASAKGDSLNEFQREWALRLKLPVEFTNSVGMGFRLIPPGQLMLGYGPNARSFLVERPFYMGATEVTQGQYEAVVGIHSRSWFSNVGEGRELVIGTDTNDYPVEFQTRDQIQAFLQGLEGLPEETGRTYRLPMVSEWEFACRGSSKRRYGFGDNAKEMGAAAWYSKNSNNRTHAVGLLTPNDFGLFDMHGNVWEWCLGDKLTKSEGFPNDSARRFRVGGGWTTSDKKSRVGYRDHARMSKRSNDLGFRIVLEIDTE